MSAFQLFTGENRCFKLLLGLLVFATAPCHGQVTESQITNGLVSYYPLDQLVPGSTNSTPDVINRRDLKMYLGALGTYMNGPAYIVAGSHPGAIQRRLRITRWDRAVRRFIESLGRRADRISPGTPDEG